MASVEEPNPQFDVRWMDGGREAKNPADPAYPEGIDVDISGGAPACVTTLPYPAPRVGKWLIVCTKCDWRGVLTAAGRADDPRFVMIPCPLKVQ